MRQRLGVQGAHEETTKKCHTINKISTLTLSKNPLQNDIKVPFFYCNTSEFDFSVDVVEGWERGETLSMEVFLAYVLH